MGGDVTLTHAHAPSCTSPSCAPYPLFAMGGGVMGDDEVVGGACVVWFVTKDEQAILDV